MAETLAQRFVSTEIASLELTDALVGIGDRVGTPKYGLVQITKLRDLLDASISIGKETIWVPAADMRAAITAPAAAGSVEIGTSKITTKTFDFDPSSAETVQFSRSLPKRWNLGTVDWQYLWSHSSTTTNFGVTFKLRGGAYGDGDSLQIAMGSQTELDDTGGTTDDLYISPVGTITVGGTPGAEEFGFFQILRDAADGSDTLAIDARLHGIFLHFTSNANTDD